MALQVLTPAPDFTPCESPQTLEWVLLRNPVGAAVIPAACAHFINALFPSTQLYVNKGSTGDCSRSQSVNAVPLPRQPQSSRRSRKVSTEGRTIQPPAVSLVTITSSSRRDIDPPPPSTPSRPRQMTSDLDLFYPADLQVQLTLRDLVPGYYSAYQ
ncbi:hypothetical protein CHARACLAT_025721, partial [Characodon lateralis]|nr:hypothetical protein [Characodon lateralis]